MNSQAGRSSPTKGPTASTDFLVVFTLVAGGFMALGLFAILVYSLQDIHKFLSVSMTALLVAAASLALGLLVGFIFGIPLSPKNEVPETPEAPPTEPEIAEGATRQAARNAVPELYRPNTSMEKISEWLATILVGIGLTQLLKIPSALDTFGTRLKPALGNTDAAPWVAIGILLLYSVTGFLIGFLWTRIKIPELYALSDIRQRLIAAREQGKEAGKSLGEKNVLDAWAESETQRKADAGTHGTEPPEDAELVPKGLPGEGEGEPLPGMVAPIKPAARRVLWVDDHPENNTSLAQVMTGKLGVQFDTSLSTKDAIARSGQGYALIISDLGRMPDRRAGFTLLKALRSQGNTTPLVIYSSRTDPGLEAEARKLGAAGFTSSPMELLSFVEDSLK